MTKTDEPDFDVIVVGSGMSGGWAAKELTERGLKVLVLERGRELTHGEDYWAEGKAPWELPNHGRVNEELADSDYAMQQTCYAFEEGTRQFFVNDKENPYETHGDDGFSWIRGYHTGGKSLMWHRQSYRWGNIDFEANKKDGHGTDWPIRYADLEKWYDHVEIFAGISGSHEGIEHLPDGQFQPPFPLNCVEEHAKAKIEAAFPDRKLIIGRTAHLTAPTEEQIELGRGPCQARNECQKGCSFGAFFSSLSATLPAAERTRNLTLVSDAIVHSVIYDAANKRATGVRVIDRLTKDTREYSARVIFLCASTLGSTQVLLNSVSEAFPKGLANTSGVLGHYLMDHPFQAGAQGTMPGFEDKYYKGRRPTGIYIPRFRNMGDEDLGFLRGYGYQGGASRPAWGRGGYEAGIGEDLKANLRKPGPWQMGIGAWGEMLPRFENRVWLDADKRDQWGLPILNIHCEWSDNERNLLKQAAKDAAEMLEAAGCVDVQTSMDIAPPGLCIHEMGTARMGRDPKTSVLNGHNQAHDVANLFVTDGAAMASTACQNPSLTYMALTARAADFAVGEMKAGRI